jgi:hypothetical protein
MNPLCNFALLAIWLLVPGCDKAEKWLDGGGLGGLSDRVGVAGGSVDSKLEALVDRSETGVRFRRDIPFPSEVRGKVNVTRKHYDVLEVTSSELGRTTERLNHKLETELGFDKESGAFEVSLTKVGRRILEEDADEEQAPLAPTAESGLENRSIRFILTEQGWKAARREGGPDFRAMVWGDSLLSSVPQLMVESGAHPRVQWFSSSRYWHQGERVVLTGNAIKMIHPYDVSGRVVLVFEGEEAVDGHPCGVFSVDGDLSMQGKIELDGSRCDSEISIKSGKIWASLLYPIILREEYDTVQTMTRWPSGTVKGPSTKLQGRIEETKTRGWLVEGS